MHLANILLTAPPILRNAAKDIRFDQATALIEGGADLLMIETVIDASDARRAPRRSKRSVMRRKAEKSSLDGVGHNIRTFPENYWPWAFSGVNLLLRQKSPHTLRLRG